MEQNPEQLPRRLKRLLVTTDLFLTQCMESSPNFVRVVNHAIPDDARVVNVAFGEHEWPGCIILVIESEMFPEIMPWDQIPTIVPIFEKVYLGEDPHAT